MWKSCVCEVAKRRPPGELLITWPAGYPASRCLVYGAGREFPCIHAMYRDVTHALSGASSGIRWPRHLSAL